VKTSPLFVTLILTRDTNNKEKRIGREREGCRQLYRSCWQQKSQFNLSNICSHKIHKTHPRAGLTLTLPKVGEGNSKHSRMKGRHCWKQSGLREKVAGAQCGSKWSVRLLICTFCVPQYSQFLRANVRASALTFIPRKAGWLASWLLESRGNSGVFLYPFALPSRIQIYIYVWEYLQFYFHQL